MISKAILCAALSLTCMVVSTAVMGEGSRSLYPSTYNSAGSRANLDLQPTQRYMDRVIRRGFNYVYALEGEYILLGSRNTQNGGDIFIYNPQDFGIPSDETIPATADFSCASGSTEPGPHYFSGTTGRIGSRALELAGPDTANPALATGAGFEPCAYRAPEAGIYGVLFQRGSGGGPNGSVANVRSSGNSVSAWDITVRDSDVSTADLNGRVFTYAFVGFTGRNNRPIFSTLYYVTTDGYRYQQELRGLDPNGYALYANTFGFYDDDQPLYKTLRGDNAQVDNLPAGVTAAAGEYPIFFSDITPGTASGDEAELVLNALGIPLSPPSPQISNVTFEGVIGGVVTTTGQGGTFTFDTTDTVSYGIVISRDGVDFDPALPANRTLSGIAYSGSHAVVWDGLGNDLSAFPPSLAGPYLYKAFGRAGEVHFPIIDAENNGNPGNANIPGGGPTITRLNGLPGLETTVFFDDRGYITQAGESIGTLNGDLCPSGASLSATPAQQLFGVDSTDPTYRLWEYGGNANSDCSPGAGWGDAKAVNLWTYFLSPEQAGILEIQEFLVEQSTVVTVQNAAGPGDTVYGTVSYANYGANPATGVDFAILMAPNLTGVVFTGLPGPYNYDSVSGTVTLSGFPTSMTPGQVFNGISFEYTAPAAGPVLVQSTITSSETDNFPVNNTSIGSTAISAVDMATAITGVPAGAGWGDTVTGSVLYSSEGTVDADNVTYSLSIGAPGSIPANVQFTSLPVGVNATYSASTGNVTLTGMPTTVLVGTVLSISFSYEAPQNGPVAIASGVISTSDTNPVNDMDSVSTAIGTVDVVASVAGVPSAGTPGGTVSGSVRFSNTGTAMANGVGYTFTIGSGGNVPASVSFPSLPGGVAASYNPATGLVTLVGMPITLDPAEGYDIGFSYPAPQTEGGTVDIAVGISTASPEAVNANNSGNAITTFDFSPTASITVSATAVCINDVPYLDYDITPVNFVPNNLATIEWVGSDSSVVETLTNQTLSDGRLLWPGAAVDGNGNATDWPGWDYVGGLWVPVPTTVVPAATLRFSVNPTAQIIVTYPATTTACATTPPGPADVETSISGVDGSSVIRSTVSGSVRFSNIGESTAAAVAYSLNIGSGGNEISAVTFSGLPAGVAATFDSSTGLVTVTGLPSSLAPGESYSFGFSYTGPNTVGANLEHSSSITTTSGEVDLVNNASAASLSLNAPTAMRSIPTMPVYMLILTAIGVVLGSSRKLRAASFP